MFSTLQLRKIIPIMPEPGFDFDGNNLSGFGEDDDEEIGDPDWEVCSGRMPSLHG